MDSDNTAGALSDPDRLLTIDEVCGLTGISRRRFEEYRQWGGGPTFLRFGRRTVRYRARDVREWIDSHEVDAKQHAVNG